MSIQIATNNEIYLDGQPTGYGASQHRDGTRVFRRGGDYIKMPRTRYSLATDKPASGQPGLAEFETDFRRVVK